MLTTPALELPESPAEAGVSAEAVSVSRHIDRTAVPAAKHARRRLTVRMT